MDVRTLLLTLHYDGAAFSGWQVQSERRTVQGELERVLAELCQARIVVHGAGRTDAGVHARGQAASIRVPVRWSPDALRRALNARLPHDVWVAAVAEMRPGFHARFSAVARRYAYHVGTDAEAHSPFRRRVEWTVTRAIDLSLLHRCAEALVGDHSFRAFAVRGTAPADDPHRCIVHEANWGVRPGGLTFQIEANRFLHHMVRFLVGTSVAIATGQRPLADLATLLAADRNDAVSPPAPAHGLFLEAVRYDRDQFLDPALP